MFLLLGQSPQGAWCLITTITSLCAGMLLPMTQNSAPSFCIRVRFAPQRSLQVAQHFLGDAARSWFPRAASARLGGIFSGSLDVVRNLYNKDFQKETLKLHT